MIGSLTMRALDCVSIDAKMTTYEQKLQIELNMKNAFRRLNCDSRSQENTSCHTMSVLKTPHFGAVPEARMRG